MCDDYFEDDLGEGLEDEGFMDEPFDEGLPGDDPLQDDAPDETESDEHYGPDWEDWMIIGPMSEEIAEERRRRRQIEREFEDDNEKM